MNLLKFYSYSALISSIFCFILSCFVYLKDKKKKINRIFSLWTLSSGMWVFGIHKHAAATTYSTASFWDKILHIAAILIPVFFLHLVIVTLNLREKKLKIIYAIAIFLLISAPTKYFIAAEKQKLIFRYFPTPGILYHFFLIFFILCTFYSGYLLLKAFIKSPPAKKNQIKYFFVGSIVAFLGGSTTFPLVYDIKILPFGVFFISPCACIIAYAIIKYHLMDINVAIKKTTLLGLRAGVPAGVYVFLVTTFQNKLLSSLGSLFWFLVAISSLLLAYFIYKQILYIIKLKDEELEKEKYKYRTILRKYTEDITKSKNFQEAATYIVRRITDVGKIKYCALVRLKEELQNNIIKNYYQIVKVADRTGKHLKYLESLMLEEEMPLITYIKTTKDYVEKNYLKYLFETKKQINPWYYYRIIKDMEVLNAELVFPAFDEDKLYGFLILGEKIDGYYTKEDIELFKVLTLQAAKSIKEVVEREEKIRLILASCNATLQALNGKDHYTRGHTERVKEYCKTIARNKQVLYEINKVPEGLWGLELAAELHDIGKIGIPDSILNKPEKLNSEEYEKIKKHPLESLKILEPLKIWLKENILNGVLQHHENYDGSGYPFGLKGKEIHIYARIIRVADAVDAMSTERPYRKPLTKQQIIEELIKYRGKWFDPIITDIFLEELISKQQIVVSTLKQEEILEVEDKLNESPIY